MEKRNYPAELIDWNDLLNGYNEMYRKDYKTVEAMIRGLYIMTESMGKVADILGVSHTTLMRKMDRLGIPRQRRAKILGKILAVPGHTKMSVAELSKVLGINRNTIRWNMYKNGIPYRRVASEIKQPKIIKFFSENDEAWHMPYAAIAKELGVSEALISRVKSQLRKECLKNT